jgi:beta-carotene 3-hydroxylase
MGVIIRLLVIAAVFILMEGVAWFLHRYVMHGFLWQLHEDHHRPTKTRFEKNDAFGLFFAVVAFILMLIGATNGYSMLFFLGLGVTAYGLGYFLFHDVMFHKRVKGFRLRPNHPYLKRIVRAHAQHHQKSTRESGICFGFLYASPKYAEQT